MRAVVPQCRCRCHSESREVRRIKGRMRLAQFGRRGAVYRALDLARVPVSRLEK